jgi:eukaryotic-like serine/threonine-protein kinase
MALSRTQMARMDALLEQVLELDPEVRLRWLESLSENNRDLEPALRRALLADDEDLMKLPKLPPTSELKPRDLFGPWRLMRRLGSGGMAEVWLAQRADGAFKREVALKLPHLGGPRQDLASRFAQETQILAALEHPHIARLYDAGVTPAGLPYLAMEYVDGEPLTRWSDRHHLEIRERLNLFVQVLDAVQYAHGHQVIHRDIKPSNILVTESGQVRLLDFGVAKLLQQQERIDTRQVHGRALTPEYASPELIRGEPVDACVDIYALGVVLYELLSGSRPYQLKFDSIEALKSAIAKLEIAPPSSHLSPEAALARSSTSSRLKHALKGDLDAIVLKALAREPRDRYQSAEGLADDLQRYLRGEPVEARPAGASYRLSRFVLRHRVGAAGITVGAIIVAVAIGYALTRPPASVQVATTAATPSIAVTASIPSDKSIAVLPFVDMSKKHDQEYFSDGLSEELIDRLSHSPDLKVIARTSAFQFKGKNEDMRTIASKLGVAHLLEGSVRKDGNELRITAKLIRADDGTLLWSQTYDRKLSEIFKVQDEIAGTVTSALNVALGSEAASRAERRMPNKEAYYQVLLGNYLMNRGDDEAEPKAVAAYTQATKIDPNYALAWAKLAMLTGKTTAEGRARAVALLQKSLSIDPNLAFAHYQLGRLLFLFEWNWSGAKSEYERAIDADPNFLPARRALAYLTEGIFGKLDRSIGYSRQITSNDPLDIGELQNLAGLLASAGQLDSAAATWRRLIDIQPATCRCNSEGYAEVMLLAGRPQEAFKALKSENLYGLALVYWRLGQKAASDEALAHFEKNNEPTGPVPYWIARVHAYRGETDAAFEWLDRAYVARSAGMVGIEVDPLLRGLRGDPRFDAMLHKLGLDDWKRKVSAS